MDDNFTTTDFGDLMYSNTTVIPPTNITPDQCNYFIKQNKTVVIRFTNQYGGIPQNLIINLIGWFLLVLLFALLRRYVLTHTHTYSGRRTSRSSPASDTLQWSKGCRRRLSC